MWKKLLFGLTVFTLLLGLVASVFASTPIKLIINGREITADVPPLLSTGRVLVPFRAVAEAFGASVTWDEAAKTVIIQSGSDSTDAAARLARLEQALASQDAATAASRWAEGVKTRNGALQYAVLAPELRQAMYAEFAAGNWSTGVSSPWIESCTVTPVGGSGVNRYKVVFTYTDSTNSKFTESQYISVKEYDGAWLISAIEKVDVAGQIKEILLDANKKVNGIYVEDAANTGSYDKAKLMIDSETRIYAGDSDKTLAPSALQVGARVEAMFNGPVLMIYPVQGGAKVIRVYQ